MRAGRLLAVSLAALSLAGCRERGPLTLNVFAAASLAKAGAELAEVYQSEHPAVRVAGNYAGTQQLRAQIESGAPADVLLSASVDDAQALAAAGLMQPPRPFVGNTLVLAASLKSDRVRCFQDALRPGVRLVVCAAAVPAGKYTQKAFEALTQAGQAETVKALKGNIVSEENDVTAATTKIALGEADAGFVYHTDVQAARLIAIDLPKPMAIRAKYTCAVAAHSSHGVDAAAFVTWLGGSEARSILRHYGFDTDYEP
jgi:molybdate transport system substrate-binding protein